MVVLETDRLILYKFSVADVDFIYELFNDSGFLRFIGDRGIHNPEDARRYLANGPIKSYAENGFGLFLVKIKDDHPSIGMCGLIKRDTLDDIDIGYAFLPAYRGVGYALEAATAVTNYAKNTLKLNRIVAITAPDNTSSIKLLEKIGFHFDKMFYFPDASEESKLFVIDFS